MSRLTQAAAMVATALALLVGTTSAQEAEGPLTRLLKSGKLPEDRQAQVIGMIGQRGGVADLTYVYVRALDPSGFDLATRALALEALAEATRTRDVRPAGDLKGLGALLRPGTELSLRRAAAFLAGTWKVEELRGPLADLAGSADVDEASRSAALEALAGIGNEAARKAIETLTAPPAPPATRAAAIAALTKLDPSRAAELAARAIASATAGDDLSPILAAFLNRQDGPEMLSNALAKVDLKPDPARLALRAVYALGRSDAGLVAVLSRAAGLDAEGRPFGPDQMAAFLADVASKGDARRGERVFRRAELNCTGCHAIGGAGGAIGPELSAIGQGNPVDYLVNSVLVPDQIIKEQYQTLVVLTVDGQVYQGIVADRDDKRVVLREATGALRTVPTADIEDQKVGGSLMPKGLPNFLTRDEFVDLVRFLSEMGKAGGPYALRSVPGLRLWRVLVDPPEVRTRAEPETAALAREVLAAPEARWKTIYATADGTVPLDEVAALAGPGRASLFLRAEVDVTAAGPVAFNVNDPDGLSLGVDGRETAPGAPVELSVGRHAVLARVDLPSRRAKTIGVEVMKTAGSAAELTAVGGK
jgi:putative heme-binding domain-containing protein